MHNANTLRIISALSSLFLLVSCVGNGQEGGIGSRIGSLFASNKNAAAPEKKATVWDLFSNASSDPNTTISVNKYIWQASLEVLDFLPVEQIDPFTGVIVMGYGRPPGGKITYRAEVFVKDPALDARSLKVVLQTSGGGSVNQETTNAVEAAILSRARELRTAAVRY